MGKRIIALIISFLLGLVTTPAILSNADDFTPSVATFDSIKTEEIKEVEPESVQATMARANTQTRAAAGANTNAYATAAAPSAPNAAAVAPALPANYISVFGRNIEVIDVGSTTVDAGNHVNRTGRFLYGHNSGAVFGSLPSLGVGSVFSVTTNGVTVNYQVAMAVVFEKNASTGRLQINGSGNYMGAVAGARHMGQQYSIALMTCYGTSYGNGDASHRYVIFANQI